MAQLDSSSGIVCTELSRDINSATRGFENTFCKLALASRVSTWMYEKMPSFDSGTNIDSLPLPSWVAHSPIVEYGGLYADAKIQEIEYIEVALQPFEVREEN